VAITDLKVQSFPNFNALVDFVAGGGVPARVQTGGNEFPMDLDGETLLIEISTDGGATYASPVTHMFGAGPGAGGVYDTIAEVVAEIQTDDTFLADLIVYAVGNELVMKTKVAGNRAVRVDADSTGIGADLLQFLSDQVGNGAVTTIQQIIQDNSGQYVLFFL